MAIDGGMAFSPGSGLYLVARRIRPGRGTSRDRYIGLDAHPSSGTAVVVGLGDIFAGRLGSDTSPRPIASRAASSVCSTVPAGPAVAVTARRSLAAGASTPR